VADFNRTELWRHSDLPERDRRFGGLGDAAPIESDVALLEVIPTR